MAKNSKRMSFKNATINLEEMTLTEYLKDDTLVYDLNKVLSDWDGVNSISLTIKQDQEIPADE